MEHPNLLLTAGNKIGSIPVQLSYQIIKHFSAGLYTSPNKAIEELVANSYDAWANHVDVIIPDNLASRKATIWVIDDGESMDQEGFAELWRIGITSKRDPNRPSKGRPPIGKFGIGKLATYVLAHELTHICRSGGKYRAVSMDFAKLGEEPNKDRVNLAVRELTAEEVQSVLKPIIDGPDATLLHIRLFGKKAAETWTVAAMSNLTDMSKKLTHGRLKRVLKTALPISPQFNLYYNGETLKPEKIKQPMIRQWIIGQKDQTANGLRFEMLGKQKEDCRVKIPQLGDIKGVVELYEKPLTGGKAEVWGRSNGFFVMVRGRLINLHDELFGLEALSHGAFSRFRMVVQADGLDEYLRATREGVSEDEEGVKNFRAYLKAKFNEARGEYETWIANETEREPISRLVSDTPRSLSSEPLIRVIRRSLRGEISDLFLTRIPVGLNQNERNELLSGLEKELEKGEFFKAVQYEALGVAAGLAIFDAQERCFKLNILHPFFANYCESARTPESFQLLAVTEVLTEAYLLDEGISPESTYRILKRRDRFLRELVYGTELSAPLVVQLLEDNKKNSKEFELALCRGMANLGFAVTPLGKSGDPDGLAVACMGIRHSNEQRQDYKVTFEAKTSEKDKIKAKDANLGAVNKHREKWDADFALEVAPGYEGDDDDNSQVISQARTLNVTLMTLESFVKLVIAASIRPLSFGRLKQELFEKCRAPKEAEQWIDGLLKEKPPETPLREIVEAISELVKDSLDPPKFAAVLERLKHKNNQFKNFREQEIHDWMTSLNRFAPDLVTIDGDCVSLENKPQIILERVISQVNELPLIFRKHSIYEGILADNKDKAAVKKTTKKDDK